MADRARRGDTKRHGGVCCRAAADGNDRPISGAKSERDLAGLGKARESKSAGRCRRRGCFLYIKYPSPSATVQDCLLRAAAGIIAGPCENRSSCSRRRTNASRLSQPRRAGRASRRTRPVRHRRDTQDSRPLLDRILDTPHLAQVSRNCSPRCFTGSFSAVDSRIAASWWRWRHPTSWRLSSISTCGAPANRAWTSSSTPIVSASGSKCWWNRAPPSRRRTSPEIDVDLVIAALAQHARVFDRAARSSRCPTDEERPRS